MIERRSLLLCLSALKYTNDLKTLSESDVDDTLKI